METWGEVLGIKNYVLGDYSEVGFVVCLVFVFVASAVFVYTWF